MKATIQLVGAAALLAMLLSGCRGNSTATPTTIPTTAPTIAPTTEPTTAPTTPPTTQPATQPTTDAATAPTGGENAPDSDGMGRTATTPDSRSGLAGSNGRIPDVENSAK
jgi:hypothetical protein